MVTRGERVKPEEWASARAVQRGETVTGQLLQIERFDGSRAFILNSGAPVMGRDDAVAGCAVAIMDITELYEAEEALRRSEAEQRQQREFLQGLRQICDEKDLMLVFDEVQCGVARTGYLYAYEYYGVTPDIMASAKGIGGGFPLGACLATEKAAAGMVIGTHGSTYGGNPFAMAAGQAVFDVVANDEFLSNVRSMGDRLRSALEQMIPNHDHLFESVRGLGLMLGVKMKTDSRAFVGYLRTKGILTVAAGDNVVRVLPPLNIEEADIAEFVEGLSAAAADYDLPEVA